MIGVGGLCVGGRIVGTLRGEVVGVLASVAVGEEIIVGVVVGVGWVSAWNPGSCVGICVANGGITLLPSAFCDMNMPAATIAIRTNAEEPNNISNDERLWLVTKSLPFRYVLPSITGVLLRDTNQDRNPMALPVT